MNWSELDSRAQDFLNRPLDGRGIEGYEDPAGNWIGTDRAYAGFGADDEFQRRREPVVVH